MQSSPHSPAENPHSSPLGYLGPVHHRLSFFLGGFFLIFCAWWHFSHIFLNWDKPIADFNIWRQAQTALTTKVWLDQGAIDLSCPLPVFGENSKVPFEFPLYQIFVFAVVKMFGLPLEEAGRVTSLFFFYSIFPAVFLLLGIHLKSIGERLFVSAFLLIAPTYLAYSRAFLVESIVLALSVYFLLFFWKWLERPTWLFYGLSAFFAILAGSVKITCLFAFSALAFFLLCLKHTEIGFKWTGIFRLRNYPVWILGLLLCGAIPVAANYLWAQYADSVKSSQPLAYHLQSHLMHAWNFGTLQQRMSPGSYRTFELFAGNLVNNRFFLLWVIAVGGILATGRRQIIAVGIMFLLFILPVAVFFNLWYAHDYYWYENGIFILAAIGFLLAPALRVRLARAWVPAVLMLVVFLSYSHTYRCWYLPVQKDKLGAVYHFAQKIAAVTPAGGTLVVSGFDWDPALPYHSNRSCIMDIHNLDSPEPVRSKIQEERAKVIGLALVGEMRGKIQEATEKLELDFIEKTPAFSDEFGEFYLKTSEPTGNSQEANKSQIES